MTLETLEYLHAYLRLGLALVSAWWLLALARSLLVAFRDDYGLVISRAGWRLWRWRLGKQPGVNSRSALDGELVRFFCQLAIFALAISASSTSRIVAGGERLPLTSSSILWTLLLRSFAHTSYRIWRTARNERLHFVEGHADA